jgi:hypothetical protein
MARSIDHAVPRQRDGRSAATPIAQADRTTHEPEMEDRDLFNGIFSSDMSLAEREMCSTRCGLLLAPLLAMLPHALSVQ